MFKTLILITGLCMTTPLFSEKPIKAIIFDCDGTLVDSEEAHFFTWRRAIQNWGGDLTPEEYLSYAGKAGATIAHQLAEKTGEKCADELFAQKREYFLEYLHQGLPPIKGTVDFVHRLLKEKEKLGIKLAIASATVKPEILKNLELLGMQDVFDVVLSGHEDLKDYHDPEGVNKPKPYIYLHAAKLLGLSPAECVVIEDSRTGVISGKAAGCITIAIPNRFTEAQDLSAATLKIDTLSGMSIDQFLQIVRQPKETAMEDQVEKYTNRMASYEQVLASLLEFYQVREWEQFHSPKNLVMDLASEAGELLDLFRWMSEEQSYHPDPETLQAIQDEIADVFKAVLYLAHKFKVDPVEATYQKLEKMKQKYPVEKCRGKSLKYTAYEQPQ